MNSTARKTSPASSEEKSLRRYIGKSYEQTDCWDLVREFYVGEFNIELSPLYSGPSHREDSKDIAVLIDGGRDHFTKVDEPQYGDLMPIKLRGIECHIGIYIGGGKFLHSVKTTGSVLDSIDRFKHMIVGYYRHRGRVR